MSIDFERIVDHSTFYRGKLVVPCPVCIEEEEKAQPAVPEPDSPEPCHLCSGLGAIERVTAELYQSAKS